MLPSINHLHGFFLWISYNIVAYHCSFFVVFLYLIGTWKHINGRFLSEILRFCKKMCNFKPKTAVFPNMFPKTAVFWFSTIGWKSHLSLPQKLLKHEKEHLFYRKMRSKGWKMPILGSKSLIFVTDKRRTRREMF